MKIFTNLLILLFVCSTIIAQQGIEPSDLNAKNSKTQNYGIEEIGDTLYTFLFQGNGTNANLGGGITVVNNQVVIASGGQYFWIPASNGFFRYTLDGTYVDSVQQNGNHNWGIRGLAQSENYVYGSESSVIRVFDKNTLEIVDTIINTSQSLHRGLAYDPEENVLFSANLTDTLFKVDVATGATLEEYGSQDLKPYGIAWDPYTVEGESYLW